MWKFYFILTAKKVKTKNKASNWYFGQDKYHTKYIETLTARSSTKKITQTIIGFETTRYSS